MNGVTERRGPIKPSAFLIDTRRSLACLAAALALCLTAVAQPVVSFQAPDPQPRLTASIQSVRSLDRAVQQLGDAATEPTTVLRQLLASLSGIDAESREAVERILRRIPPAGAGFQCNREFVRLATRKAVLRVKDRLLGAAPDAVEPAVCYAIPFALDLNRPATPIEIYGADFDTVSLQAIVTTRDGYRDVTSMMTPRSHYHLTLRLPNESIPPGAISIGLAWGHLIGFSIPLVASTTRLCESRIETIPPKAVSVVVPRVAVPGVAAPSPGSRWAEAALDYSNNELQAMVCLSDFASHESVASACVAQFLHTTDPDSVIEGVVGKRRSYIDSIDGGRPPFVRREPRGELVRQWSVVGSPALEEIAVEFDGIRVVSTHDEECLSPVAYAEARRSSALSAATRRLFDPKLRQVDPAIVALRPRFAPVHPQAPVN